MSCTHQWYSSFSEIWPECQCALDLLTMAMTGFLLNNFSYSIDMPKQIRRLDLWNLLDWIGLRFRAIIFLWDHANEFQLEI